MWIQKVSIDANVDANVSIDANVDANVDTKGINRCRGFLKVCIYDVVLFTTNRYFSLIEALNLKQTLTVQRSLNTDSTTHID